MRKFKCLMSVVLSLIIILSGVNNCFGAWWVPQEGDIVEFMDETEISLNCKSKEDIEKFFIKGQESDFLNLIFDMASVSDPKKVVVNFMRKVIGFKFVAEKNIWKSVNDALIDFRKNYSEQIEAIKKSNGAKSSIWKRWFRKEEYQKEVKVKKLIFFVILLESGMLSPADKKFACDVIDSLLGKEVIEDLKGFNIEAEETEGKIKRAEDGLRVEIDGKVKELGKEIAGLRVEVNGVKDELDGKVKELEKEIAGLRGEIDELFRDVSESTSEIIKKLGSRSLSVSKKDLEKFEAAYANLSRAFAARKSLFKDEDMVLSRIEELEKTARDFGEQLDRIGDMNGTQRNALREKVVQLLDELEVSSLKNDVKEAVQKAEKAQRTADAVEQELEKLKLTVEEIGRVKDEQSRLNELTAALTELSGLIRKMSTEGTLNSEESERVIAKVDASMRRCGVTEEDDSDAKESSDAEVRKLHRSMAEMKKRIKENIEDINRLQERTKGLEGDMDAMTDLHEALIEDRAKWEKRAIDIEQFADGLKRDEKYLEAISEGKARDFVWQQYKQSNWFGKWRLRGLFSFLKEMKLEEQSEE